MSVERRERDESERAGKFGAYQKARQLFDLAVKDMEALKTNSLC